MPTLASCETMMQRDRKREGLRGVSRGPASLVNAVGDTLSAAEYPSAGRVVEGFYCPPRLRDFG